MQRGPLPLCRTNPISGLPFGGSTSTPPAWASVSTESWLRGSRLLGCEPLSRRGTCPEPKGGDGVHACLGCATTTPPWRYIWDTTAMLSVLTITWHPLSEGRKWISARKTALSSRQFMCQEWNSPVQIPHAGPRPSLSRMHPSWPFGDGESRPFWLHSGEKGDPAILKGCESSGGSCGADPWKFHPTKERPHVEQPQGQHRGGYGHEA